MDDLFALLVVRAPQTVTATPTVQIPLGDPTEFQLALAEARNSAPHPQKAVWAVAEEFIGTSDFVKDPATLPLAAEFHTFDTALSGLPDPVDLAALTAAVTQSFGASPTEVSTDPRLWQDVSAVGDAIVAVNLTATLPSLDDHVRLLRLAALVLRIARGDATLAAPGGVTAALAALVALPSTIFPVDQTMIQPLGVADHWVVRQHIKGYVRGEIASIDNILMGETRKHATAHTLATEQTLVTETEKITETIQELQTTDRFDLKSEVDNTLKEDLSAKAGLSVKYDSKPWVVTANVDVAYQRSKSDATKLATEQAKDVVRRASTKVTERIRQQQTTKISESFTENDEHTFDNSHGAHHVTGIYQWVNKVYRVQTFDLGPRTIYDIMVPEPAALLWDLRRQPADSGETPQPPPPFTATPADLSADPSSGDKYFGHYISLYGVTGAPAPPPDQVTVSAAYSDKSQHPDDDKDNLNKSDVLNVPTGYRAISAVVRAQYNYKKDHQPPNSGLNIMVGGQAVGITSQTVDEHVMTLAGETASLPVSISSWEITDYALTVDVHCTATPQLISDWQVKVHDAITQTYLQRVKDYQEQLAARAFQTATTAAQASNPDLNRQIEQTELKRSTIALLAGPTVDLLSFNGLTQDSKEPTYPRPNPDRAEAEGRIARFFEQALEWENMNYFLYPYYWGRKETWYQRVAASDDDPLHLEFLRAGQARVVVPVRKGFEDDVEFFVRSGGKLWQGAPMPDVHRVDYLPIAEEIRAAQGGGDLGAPGAWWETTLPTNQVYLRGDRVLPSWEVDDRWNWTETADPNA